MNKYHFAEKEFFTTLSGKNAAEKAGYSAAQKGVLMKLLGCTVESAQIIHILAKIVNKYRLKKWTNFSLNR